MADCVFIRNLRLETVVGLDRWGRPWPQPVLVTVRIAHNCRAAAAADQLEQALDYERVRVALAATVAQGPAHASAGALVSALRTAVAGVAGAAEVRMEVALPGAGRGAGIVRVAVDAGRWELWFEDVRVRCRVGVTLAEQRCRQLVVVRLRMRAPTAYDDATFQHRLDPIIQLIEDSSFLTVEALAGALAVEVLRDFEWDDVLVSVEKPEIYTNCDGPGVDIFRTRSDIEPKPT